MRDKGQITGYVRRGRISGLNTKKLWKEEIYEKTFKKKIGIGRCN